MVTVTVNGTPRGQVGKSSTKAARNAGQIPCVLYGGSGENIHFTTTFTDVRGLIYTPEFKMADVQIDGKNYRCLVKDVQFDPVRDEVTHIDFLQLTDGQAIKVEVPLTFEGTSPGVRNGGKFTQKIRVIKIKTTPESLVDKLVADISKLKLGMSLRIRDISPVPGVEILNPAALPIASVTVPRALKGAAEEEEEGAEEAATEEAAAE
jgi:large subunit ribosomal protein L25